MKIKKKLITVLIYIILITGGFLCLVPLLWMLRSSLMTNVEIFMIPIKWIPETFRWENYKSVFTTLPFLRYYWNSVRLTFLVVMGTVITSSLWAFYLTAFYLH